MENFPKKRGRKKKIDSNENNAEENNSKNLDNNNDDVQESNKQITEQIVIKKRGRKKKWEVETKTKSLENNPIIFGDSIKDDNVKVIEENIKLNYEQEQISFGNLNIKIQSNKEVTNVEDIKNSLKGGNTDKNISAIQRCSKTKNNTNSKLIDNSKRQFKILKYFEDEYSTGMEILTSDFRCYNCHHNFPNKPFYLPVDYCEELNRYKVMGNFCSPNCVKSYALSHKIYSNKAYLVGQMYRKLLGHQIIKKAPPIQCLKEYGGFMDINEYRETFNKFNTSYNLNTINSKVIFEQISMRNSFI